MKLSKKKKGDAGALCGLLQSVWSGRTLSAPLLTGGTLKKSGDRSFEAHGPKGWPNQTVATLGLSGHVDCIASLQDKNQKRRRRKASLGSRTERRRRLLLVIG
jgi:hypothetical protein